MDKYDLLEAMSGIRDEYVEEASGLQADQETGQEKQKSLSGRQLLQHFRIFLFWAIISVW